MLRLEGSGGHLRDSWRRDQGYGVTVSDDLSTPSKDRGGVLDTMVSRQSGCVYTENTTCA